MQMRENRGFFSFAFDWANVNLALVVKSTIQPVRIVFNVMVIFIIRKYEKR